MSKLVEYYLKMRGKISNGDSDKHALDPAKYDELKKITEDLLSREPEKAKDAVNG